MLLWNETHLDFPNPFTIGQQQFWNWTAGEFVYSLQQQYLAFGEIKAMYIFSEGIVYREYISYDCHS